MGVSEKQKTRAAESPRASNEEEDFPPKPLGSDLATEDEHIDTTFEGDHGTKRHLVSSSPAACRLRRADFSSPRVSSVRLRCRWPKAPGPDQAEMLTPQP